MLVLYDLNGFKRFNDLFGHPAGDALLARLAAKLTDVVGPAGTCYRLGGDEFCVLARVPEGELEAFLDATTVALSESGDGFEVTTSLGCVFLPEEATDSDRAMQIADQRLYARKHHSLIERGQPHGVLLQALYEREPDLRRHVGRVSALSVELGRRLETRRRGPARRSSSRPSCTTSASLRSPTRSSTSRSPSLPRSSRSFSDTRSSASASSARPPL